MKIVLFVCTHNAGRSQMARAFFERLAPPDVRAESAGQEPADAVWPEVVEVMREAGFDLSAERPKKLDLEQQLHADWAVTLGCGGTCPYVPATVEDWDVPDPHGRPLDEVRAIRDEIERRVRELVTERIDLVRADRSAHRARLERLLKPLAEEFGGEARPEVIRACADRYLAEYGEAPVRSFAFTLAYREARECLRDGRCVPA